MSRELDVNDALNELIVTHPMWIDDDGNDLDYSPERECRISDFLNQAAELIAAHETVVKAEALRVAASHFDGLLARREFRGSDVALVLNFRAAQIGGDS